MLAVVAIWLSIVFYRLSSAEAQKSAQNASTIAGSVEKLEGLFDRFYSDTFTIFRETVGDMRQHFWQKPDATGGAEAPGAEDKAQKEILEEIRSASTELGIAADQTRKLLERVSPAVRESVEEVATEPSLRSRIFAHLMRRHFEGEPLVTVDEIASNVLLPREQMRDVVNTLFRMRENGEVTWGGSPVRLRANQRVRIASPADRSEEEGSDSPGVKEG